jgi:hypothetical protein
MAGSCDYGNEPSVSIKDVGYFNSFGDYELLEDSRPWSWPKLFWLI